MGIADKAKHLAEELTGKAKVAAGDATDDHSLAAEGHGDQAKANAGEAKDNVVDALREAGNAVKGEEKTQP